MQESPSPNASVKAQDLTFLKTIWLGLLVLFSELQWMTLLAIRNWEISQLRKRLNQELHGLGLVEAAMAGLDVPQEDAREDFFIEKELSLKQISFLSEEIKHLSSQLELEHKEYVSARVESWGI